VTIARQQAKIAQLEQEIQEATASNDMLEPIVTNKVLGQSRGQGSYAMDQDSSQDSGSVQLQPDSDAQQSMTGDAHRQPPAHRRQPDNMLQACDRDAVMTESVQSASEQQSIWL